MIPQKKLKSKTEIYRHQIVCLATAQFGLVKQVEQSKNVSPFIPQHKTAKRRIKFFFEKKKLETVPGKRVVNIFVFLVQFKCLLSLCQNFCRLVLGDWPVTLTPWASPVFFICFASFSVTLFFPQDGQNCRSITFLFLNSIFALRLFFLFPPPHTSSFFSVTSGFTRLSMKTKYICRGLIGLYVNFHNTPIKWSTNLHVKIRRWGGGKKEKEPALLFSHPWIVTLKNYHSIVINVMKLGKVNKLQQFWTDSSYFTAWFYAFSHNYKWNNIVKQKPKKLKGSGKWKISSILIVHQFHISYFTWNFAWFPPGLNCSTFPGWPKCATIRASIY